jgi:hypothetical protein
MSFGGLRGQQHFRRMPRYGARFDGGLAPRCPLHSVEQLPTDTEIG